MLGDDGVADLVDQDAREERQGRHHAGGRVAQPRIAGGIDREAGVSEADGEEGGDQDERPVEADGDPSDSPQPNALLHLNPLPGAARPYPPRYACWATSRRAVPVRRSSSVS